MAVINCRPHPLLNPLGLLLTSSSWSFTIKTVANQKDLASFIVEHSSTRCTVIPRRSIASCRRFQRRRLDRHCRLDDVIHTHVGLAESMKFGVLEQCREGYQETCLSPNRTSTIRGVGAADIECLTYSNANESLLIEISGYLT